MWGPTRPGLKLGTPLAGAATLEAARSMRTDPSAGRFAAHRGALNAPVGPRACQCTGTDHTTVGSLLTLRS